MKERKQKTERKGEEQSSLSILDYENIFLGALVSGAIDPEEVTKVKKEYFTSEENIKLFSVCQEVYLKSSFIDFVSVLSGLSKELGADKAKARLEKLTSFIPSEFSSSAAINELETNYIKRQSSILLEKAKIAILESPQLANEIMFAAYERISTISSSGLSYDLEEEIDHTVDAILDGKAESQVIRTGFKAIDDTMGGLSTQEITIIAGRPGHGKTTVSVGLSNSILKSNPDAVVVKFELEMSKEQIKRKFLSLNSGVSSYKMRVGNLTKEDHEKIQNAGAKMKDKYNGRLYVFDNIYDLSTMMKVCREVKATVCMVDFVTLMDGIDEDARRQIGQIAKRAKRFAKAHNMAWIFFSQLNRGAEGRDGNRPSAGDLAESDYLTQLASEVILLFYRYKYNLVEAEANRLSLIFDKARFATINEKKVYFNPDLCIIKDI